jgi:hypothetical protein
MKNILAGYIESALSNVEYNKLVEGTFSGKNPYCR